MLGHLGMHPEHLIHRFAYMKTDIPVAGVAHQAGTCVMGTDPAASVVNTDCRAHEVENLYVVDTSVFPSIGAVNPALTAMANALRVGDHLLDRMGVPSTVGAAARSSLSPVSPRSHAQLEWILVAQPVQLTPARSQMAFTLGFHILLVPMGVVLPTLMLIANYKGLRHGDTAALTLARRWSHVAGLTFAVGAVTGTVLSFEMGLLWPGFTKVFGDVFGLPFAIEGIAFFLEALLVAIYIYGWRRLKPWTHFWLGFPIPFVAIIGALSIISANSWMNSPAGFTHRAPTACRRTSTRSRRCSTRRCRSS